MQIAHMSLNTRVAKRRQRFAWRKILSDVDDTMCCSGGSFPAGVDDSFPKKVVYPGVLAFYRELDLGTSARADSSEEWTDERVGNLVKASHKVLICSSDFTDTVVFALTKVFLSARPHVYKDLSENQSFEKFRKLLDSHRLHTSPSLLAGSLDTGSQFIVGGSMEPLARKKFENFVEYLALYPEFRCIFIGDNGQSDVRASEMLLADRKYDANLERVYIHEVLPLSKTHAQSPVTRSRGCPRLFYFKSYVDAALDAYRNQLIRASGLRRVTEEALRDFGSIPEVAWVSGVSGGLRGREARRLELLQAIRRANQELAKAGLEQVRVLPAPCLYPSGAVVVTAFGRGVVERYRPQDGMYSVLLQWDGSGNRGPVKAFMSAASLSPMSAAPSDRSAAPTVASIASAPYVKGKTAPPDKSGSVLVATVGGALVWTPYGTGRLVGTRHCNKVLEIEVQLVWGATAYLQPGKVVILALPSPDPRLSASKMKAPLSNTPKSPPLASTRKAMWAVRPISAVKESPAVSSLLLQGGRQQRPRGQSFSECSSSSSEAKQPLPGAREMDPLASPRSQLWNWYWTAPKRSRASSSAADKFSGDAHELELPAPLQLPLPSPPFDAQHSIHQPRNAPPSASPMRDADQNSVESALPEPSRSALAAS